MHEGIDLLVQDLEPKVGSLAREMSGHLAPALRGSLLEARVGVYPAVATHRVEVGSRQEMGVEHNAKFAGPGPSDRIGTRLQLCLVQRAIGRQTEAEIPP